MIFDTLQYVDGSGATQEVALQLSNLCVDGPANQVQMTPVSHSPGSFIIKWPQPPETGIAIPFKSRCKVFFSRTSSTGAANSFTGGVIGFQGRRTDNQGSASGAKVMTQITLSDAWWDLTKMTFCNQWREITGGTWDAPTYTPFLWPDVVMFQPYPGVTYDPAPVSETITTWQQIVDILNFAIGFASGDDAVQLQIGTAEDGGPEFTPVYRNWKMIRAEKCAQAILYCLQSHPGVFTEIDYTTTPPTIHFRDRSHMTAVNLPYKSTDDSGIMHVASNIMPLEELVPDAVRIYYKITGSFNGQPAITWSDDIYPADAPNSLLCLDYSVDVTGAATAETIVNFVSHSFDATDLDLWRLKVPSLKQISQGGQVINDGSPGALTLLDTTINGGSGHPDGIQVVDDNGDTIDLSDYDYYTDENVFKWMQLPGGGSAGIVSATVTAFFSYIKQTGGALNLTPQITRHSHSFRIKLTTAPTGVYILKQTLNAGEAIPSDLAESLYNELSVLQWKLDHEIFQCAPDTSTVPTLIKPGRDMVNLVGGDVLWETMNAVPERVNIQFYRNAAGQMMARHQISCGPVNHLEPDALLQLANVFWNRNRYGIDPNQRLTGTVSSNQVDLSADAAKENSVPANADFGIQPTYAPDAVNTGTSNVVQIDATLGQVTVIQQDSSAGTTRATGLIMPRFNGIGAPSSTTLAANAYFRQFSTYVDMTTPTAPVLYICTTSGTNSSSVWAQISAGGGSSGLQQFRIVSDGGDYWVAQRYIGSTLGPVTQNIIKPYKLRAGANAIASETILGVTYTYSYTAVTVGSVTGYYTRSVSGSDGSSETDYTLPDPIYNDFIYALPCPDTTLATAIPQTILSASLVNPGTGGTYAVNDVLTVAGGTGTAATIKVGGVAAGKITSWIMLSAGSYSALPSMTANAVTGGGGSGATFNLTAAPTMIDINADGRAWSA